MLLRNKIACVLLIFCASGIQPVAAQPPLPAAEAVFDYQDTLYFTWAGLRLGQLTLHMQQRDDGHYTMTTDGKTGGIVSLFNSHRSHSIAEGIHKESRYIPAVFRSEYVDDGEKKRVEVLYDTDGNPTSELIDPPREEIRPLVPEEAKRHTLDILSGFFQMRQELITALQQGKKAFSVTIYDGKRLFRVDATIMSTAQNVLIHATDTLLPSLKLRLQRVALAGYKEKELKNIAKRNPPIDLYVEPERLVPFGLSLRVYGARLEAWIKPDQKQKEFEKK